MASDPAIVPTGVATHFGAKWPVAGSPPFNDSGILNSYAIHATPVPEPSSLALLSIGGIGMAFGAYPLALAVVIWRRDWVPASILLFVLAQYVPWLVADRPLFLFYVTPIVPFMALALAWAAGFIGQTRYTRWVPGLVIAIAVASFAYFYPVFVGVEMSYDAWYQRMWFDDWI
jgi:dolichyl-phosphate-mannose-protein mannosyltransferase